MRQRAPRYEDASRSMHWLAEALGKPPPRKRLAALASAPILLTIGPAAAATRRGQLMLATAANIVGRLFDFAPAIDVEAGSARALRGAVGFPEGEPLAAAVVAALASRAARPQRYRYGVGSVRGRYAGALVIGDGAAPTGVDDVVYADGQGWIARVGRTPLPLAGQSTEGPADPLARNPFGPLVAAALGAAEIAKGIFRRFAGPARAASFPALEHTITWDLWRHAFDSPSIETVRLVTGVQVESSPPLPAELDLGRVALAGLGALGSAAVWALAQIEGARGTLELVDDDTLSPSNLERVLTAVAADVGESKVRVAARALEGTGLRAVEIAARYGIAAPARARATAVLVGVDSGGARRRIMNLLPRAAYNGGTQAGELLVSRHVDLEGPCLECLYPEVASTVSAQAQPCGGGVVLDDLPAPTISFVSALCGFLMACEVVKDRAVAVRQTPLDAVRPALRIDLLTTTLGPECIEALVPRRDCFCQDPATRQRFAERLCD
jgi:hypothetical protein